jgi:hypothetical protein
VEHAASEEYTFGRHLWNQRRMEMRPEEMTQLVVAAAAAAETVSEAAQKSRVGEDA